MDVMILEVDTITKSYDRDPVLRGVSMATAPGEIVCLLGPSGCGKSTLLRVIAGLEPDYTGSVRFRGQVIDHVPPHARGFGLMFQDWALFPHRTVAQNLAFGLRMQRLPRAQIARRVAEMLDLVGLPGYGERTIFELSGGERQRVALARSLAPEPRLLMLDEPLGALDRTLRERLTEELRTIIKRVGLTSIYVTHDQAEAFTVADRILVMNRGQIVQNGTPAAVYRHPASPFVARFLGLTNLFPAQQVDSTEQGLVAQTSLGPLLVADAPASSRLPLISQAQLVLVRPEAAERARADATNIIDGEILRTTFRGGMQRIVLQHSSGNALELDVETGFHQAVEYAAGQHVQVALRPDAITLVPADKEAWL
jgi:ABC-type Fe3+/spermidine/putrescine transport system ATPase subunit